MRITSHLVVLSAVLATPLVGCGGDDVSSGPLDRALGDAASESSSGDGGAREAAADGPAVDGLADGISADGAIDSMSPAMDGPTTVFEASTTADGPAVQGTPDAGTTDATVMDGPQGTVADAADASVGAVVITADATLQVPPPGYTCAGVDFLSASPNETAVGYPIALTASGVDPSGQDWDVTLTWSATGSAGSLTGTTGSTNTFLCTAAGTATVTVTAAVWDGGASCAATGTQIVTLTCDAP